jgi:glycerol-3-phosphate acyltransferase PlsY
LASFALVVAFSRYVSLGAIVAAVFAPFYQALIWGPEPLILAIAVMSLLLIWRHEGNIRKLLAGTESKLGQKAVALPPGPLQDVDKPRAQHHGQHHGQHPAKHHTKHKRGHS